MCSGKTMDRVAEVTYESCARELPLGPAHHGPLLKLEAAAGDITALPQMRVDIPEMRLHHKLSCSVTSRRCVCKQLWSPMAHTHFNPYVLPQRVSMKGGKMVAPENRCVRNRPTHLFPLQASIPPFNICSALVDGKKEAASGCPPEN